MHTNFVIQSNIINRYANQVSTVLIDRKGRSMNITEFSTKYLYLIDSLRNFYENSANWDIKEYIEGCTVLVRCLKESNEEEIKNLNLRYVCNKALLVMIDTFCEDDNQNIVNFSELICNSYIIKEKICEDEDLCFERNNSLMEAIQEYFFCRSKDMKKDFYKNLFEEKYCKEFESILCLIKNELELYDTNLVYCKKIIDFITNEFNEKGIYITHTIFLNNYLKNAVDSMILTICKFFLDNPDIEKKKNCGIQYLKLFVEKNLKNDEKAVIQEKLKDVRNKIKEGKKIAKKIQSMRNSLIAHYDIEKIEYVKQIRMNIEEFETIFNLSCEILELLSLYYFHFEENNSYDIINAQGFKFSVCQNCFMHNPNPGSKMDLDIFFDILRKDFIVKQAPKNDINT